MEKSVFDFQNYKQFLSSWLKSRPANGHGERSKIAKALNCQTAYVSQVLNSGAHFSLEQAEALNHYLGHSKEERHFFLLLLQRDRAGTQSLTKYFTEQIEEVLSKRLVLKDRLGVSQPLTIETQATYYSAWYYATVHVLLSIPQFQSREAIAKYLNLPLERVSEILEFLCSAGLAIQDGGIFKIGTSRIHLGTDSPMLAKHHTNWRMQAIQSLDRKSERDLHYSSIVTLAQSDVEKIKSLLVKAIEEAKLIVRPSKEEEVHCLSLDFFEIRKN